MIIIQDFDPDRYSENMMNNLTIWYRVAQTFDYNNSTVCGQIELGPGTVFSGTSEPSNIASIQVNSSVSSQRRFIQPDIEGDSEYQYYLALENQIPELGTIAISVHNAIHCWTHNAHDETNPHYLAHKVATLMLTQNKATRIFVFDVPLSPCPRYYLAHSSP
jgi:hypothetical protein